VLELEILLVVVGIYVGVTFYRIVHALQVGKRVTRGSVAFEKLSPTLKQHILVLGDSTMYGAGIKQKANTMGGLLAAQYPKATIETLAVNGDKVANLQGQLSLAKFDHYSLIMIGIGGNDIVGLTDFKRLASELDSFLRLASQKSSQIVLFQCVNVGNIGFFLFPLNYFYSHRCLVLSKVFEAVSSKYTDVLFVNLYRSKQEDFYTKKSRGMFIAEDSFHPSDYANRFFFKLIWDRMVKAGISSPKP
jgi:hypothetical protein